MMNSYLCTAALLLLLVNAANAEIIRCEVTDRSHRLMPEWIEYELRERGTILEVRDSVGMGRGVGWVRGSVLENTDRRMTLGWNIGMQPIGNEWAGSSASVDMRMTRLPNGRILVTGVPSLVAYGHSVQYRGRAVCASQG